MEKRLRIFWGILLLLSIGWMAFGFASALEVAQSNESFQNVYAQLEAQVSNLGISADEGLPLLFFLVSGLPPGIISVFFIWRNSAGIASGRKRRGVDVRRKTLLVSLLAFIAVLILWNIRELELLVYPLRLFVTYIHEASHSLAALITGGQVQGFTVAPNGSGLAITAGGSSALILPAGYLGAALFGSLLFFLSNRAPNRVREAATLIGIFLILFTALYARPDQSNGSLTAFSIGIGFGLVLIVMGWNAPRVINQFVLSALAIMTALHAVLDIWWLVGNADVGRGSILNDAAAFAEQFTPLFSASVVAFIWAVAAVAMLGGAVYFGAIKPLKQEITDAVKGESA